jgi:hypothetical protein
VSVATGAEMFDSELLQHISPVNIKMSMPIPGTTCFNHPPLVVLGIIYVRHCQPLNIEVIKVIWMDKIGVNFLTCFRKKPMEL